MINNEHEFHVDSFVNYISSIKDNREKYILTEFMMRFFKSAENQLRKELVDEYTKKYAHKIENGKLKIRETGYDIAIELKTNINLEEEFKKDKDHLNERIHELEKEEQECFEWKLTLNDSKFKKLKKHAKENELQYDLFDMVVETPGTPTMTLKRSI